MGMGLDPTAVPVPVPVSVPNFTLYPNMSAVTATNTNNIVTAPIDMGVNTTDTKQNLGGIIGTNTNTNNAFSVNQYGNNFSMSGFTSNFGHSAFTNFHSSIATAANGHGAHPDESNILQMGSPINMNGRTVHISQDSLLLNLDPVQPVMYVLIFFSVP